MKEIPLEVSMILAKFCRDPLSILLLTRMRLPYFLVASTLERVPTAFSLIQLLSSSLHLFATIYILFRTLSPTVYPALSLDFSTARLSQISTS